MNATKTQPETVFANQNRGTQIIGYLNIGNRRDEIRLIGGALFVARAWHAEPIGTERADIAAIPCAAAQRYLESPEFCLL